MTIGCTTVIYGICMYIEPMPKIKDKAHANEAKCPAQSLKT